MRRNLIYTLILSITFIGQIYGQVEPMPPFEVYTPEYQTYRYEKDLYSFNLIDYMFEDHDKKVWLSTIHDLKRTNGYQFFNITQILDGQNPLKGHITDGQYWNDSTQYLLEHIEDNQFRGISLSPSPPISIQSLDSVVQAKDRLQFYDVLRNENAYEVWSDSLNNLTLKIISPDGTLVKTIEIPEIGGDLTGFSMTTGHMWLVINRRKILSFEITEDGQLISFPPLLSHRNIQIFHSDQFDNIWVTRRDSILQIRNFAEGYGLSPLLPIQNIGRIFEDNHGNLIMGSVTFPNDIGTAYLYLREGGRWITLEYLIERNRDIHLFAGQNFQKEIFIAAQNNFSVLRFSDNPICEVLVDRKIPGNRWNFISRGLNKTDSMLYVIATNKGMLAKNLLSGEERLVQFSDPRTGVPLKFDCLRTIEKDASGQLWFSACESLEGNENNHLIRYDPQTQRSKILKIPNPVSAIGMGKDSILWIALQISEVSQSIAAFQTGRLQLLSNQNLPINIGKINDIEIVSKDTLLLGTDLGLYQYYISTNKIDPVNLHPDAKVQTSIFSIFNFDNAYFLACRDGLFIYKPGNNETLHYTMDQGLRNNIITAVFRERKNKYWLGTFYGVSMLNMDENLILNYSTLDGLPENEFNLHSYFQDQTGYYLGYPNGVLRLNLRDSMVSYFSDYDLDHALVYTQENENPDILFPENNQLNIPPDITYFKLFPTSYANYFIDYFNYKLVNNTRKDTIPFSAANGIILSNLDAGNYNFSLLAFDRYGNRLPGYKNFSLTINEHFYKTTWFRLIILLLGNILLGLLIYWILRRRSREKRKTEQLAKRLSELELQVLQAQLNPHFIFNTISAIQYYIQDHDEERADMYLTSFSRLMRMYLDSSKSSFIPLDTEISLLTNYLDLEMMVSEGQIEAQYEIDPSIDLENVVIPTMMLQPFVENAIQHGLFHKKEKGCLVLRFIQLSDVALLCEIEDDGIGRTQAEIINKNKPQKPASRALQIINEKLEVLAATQNLNIQIKIIDKYHEGQAKGTLVQVKFPVIKAGSVQSLVQL